MKVIICEIWCSFPKFRIINIKPIFGRQKLLRHGITLWSLRFFHRPKISPIEILALWLPHPWTPTHSHSETSIISHVHHNPSHITSASNFIATWILTTTVMVTLSVQYFYKVKQQLSYDVKREDARNFHISLFYPSNNVGQSADHIRCYKAPF